jgi:carbonic anhydrase/acetyltransferase-like protein (isoleucine patch superfamily)
VDIYNDLDSVIDIGSNSRNNTFIQVDTDIKPDVSIAGAGEGDIDVDLNTNVNPNIRIRGDHNRVTVRVHTKASPDIRIHEENTAEEQIQDVTP